MRLIQVQRTKIKATHNDANMLESLFESCQNKIHRNIIYIEIHEEYVTWL